MKQVVAFDIDDTLIDSRDGSIIPKTMNLIKRFYQDGFTVYLITARNLFIKKITEYQLKQHKVDKYVSLKKGVFYTNGLSKVPFLKKTKSVVFFDDNPMVLNEVLEAKDMGILGDGLQVFKVFYVNNKRHNRDIGYLRLS